MQESSDTVSREPSNENGSACPASPQHSRRSADFGLDDDDWFNWEDPQCDVEVSGGTDILHNLPAQLHPAVSLGIRRVSSCYFSINSTPSNSVNDLLSLWEENDSIGEGGDANETGKDTKSPKPSKEWNACDILYHDIMMHVFTFLDARALAAFSETAHRPNFECFYFLQLQLQRALLVIKSEEPKEREFDVLSAIGGSGCVSRLALEDSAAAQEIVQTYTSSNSTLRTMPLSHSLAYVRHVLRSHGFHSHTPNASQSVAGAAFFITLVGFSASIAQHVDYSTVDLSQALLKMGLAGSVLKAGVSAGNAARKKASEQDMRETAEQMARMMHELPSQLLQQLQHGVLRNNPNGGEESDEESSGRNFPSAIAARMYAAFSTAYGPDSSPDVATSSPQRPRRDQRGRRIGKRRSVESSLMDIQESVPDDDSLKPPENDVEAEEVLQAVAMQHPFTPNPYDHLPKGITESTTAATEEDEADQLKEQLTKCSLQKMPSGCVGAYSRAIHRASEKLTKAIKDRRKNAFEALPEMDRIQISTNFIDACTSDETLSIVKDMLQSPTSIDVDGFFVGSDGTETCALHTASFHGASKVVEFLIQGIDENCPENDGGLCSVDLTDLNGWSAMHFAAGANSVEVVRVLAKHGANLTVEALNGYTPFHWAQRLANTDVADELQRLGADKRFIDTNPLSIIANRFFSMIPTH